MLSESNYARDANNDFKLEALVQARTDLDVIQPPIEREAA